MTTSMVRFWEVLWEPSEEDLFEKYFFETLYTCVRRQDTIYPFSLTHPDDTTGANRQTDTIHPFAGSRPDETAVAKWQTGTSGPVANSDLPSTSVLKRQGQLPCEACPRVEMKDMVPHECQAMSDSQFVPAPNLEPLKHMKHHAFQVKRPLLPPPSQEQRDVLDTQDSPGPYETICEVVPEHRMDDDVIPSWCGRNKKCQQGNCIGKTVYWTTHSCCACQMALDSYLDHQCPKCSAWFCVSCVASSDLDCFCCQCGDWEANQEILQKNRWMIKAYHSTCQALNSFSAYLSSWMPSNCGNEEIAQSLKDCSAEPQIPLDVVPDRTCQQISLTSRLGPAASVPPILVALEDSCETGPSGDGRVDAKVRT